MAFNTTSQESICWKTMKQVAPIISDNLKWKVGNGSKIDSTSRHLSLPWFGNMGAFKVVDITDKVVDASDLSRIEDIYHQSNVDQFKFVPNPNLSSNDRLVWNIVASGVYSPNKGFNMLSRHIFVVIGDHSPQSLFPWKDFWKTKIQPIILLH